MSTTPLRLEREKAGLTVHEVAVAVGVQQPTINRIENMKKRASPELANRIAKFFANKVTRDQILFPEDYVDGVRKPVRAAEFQEAS